ncbi:3'(2'),5'-bisphosphate nucleotidase CysQ [Nocardia elegans]|uniref:3'(2'),5'-bisphosphate nucleotidase CysQ n=1 Tax=Nocardia elegans TaxID=300029 RepID=UPI001894BC72|nr:3'(2'),5'-bisphosphate nucleotidase CysQ [Nocardia elegans]MBF6451106.1 3'(2'),5'-bisphosphate nucleotidase CysQ [Nocardia elegans]
MDDHAVAAEAASQAGAALLTIRAQGGAAGDRHANELLLEHLQRLRPDDAVLSEESPDDHARLDRRRVWIIDPLDGTREYGEPPRTDWAVHVALAVDHVPVAGAVALPGVGLVLHTGAPPSLPPRLDGPLRIALSRSRPSDLVQRVVTALSAIPVPMGSAGAKAMAVVRGEADVYLHSGGQYEWDSCAPVAVAAAAGLHVSCPDGTVLRYNQPAPYLPDLLICRPEFADAVVDAVLADIARNPSR